LAIGKAEIYQGRYKMQNNHIGETTILAFFEAKKEERYQTRGNYINWDPAQKYLDTVAVSKRERLSSKKQSMLI